MTRAADEAAIRRWVESQLRDDPRSIEEEIAALVVMRLMRAASAAAPPRERPEPAAEPPPPYSPDDLLTTSELADLLKIPRESVYSLPNSLPSFRLGRQLRYRYSEVMNWLETVRQSGWDVRNGTSGPANNRANKAAR